MNTLAAIQDALQDWLLEGDAAIAGCVDADDAAHRLRIYADAYRLRLVEVLGDDFPATRAALGDAAFDALASGYLRAHPSARPSVRHFGHAFADWLETRRESPQGLHELARFEWLQGECFDAADADSLGIADVAVLPAEAWPSLRLQLHPSARLLSTRRLSLQDDMPMLANGTDTANWLLWRIGFDVHWRRLETDEAPALQAAEAGETFARLCERLNEPNGDGALRAAVLLKRWLADGVLAAPPTR